MVNKNNNEAGAQGKTEGFYGSPYKAGSRVLAPQWYGASIQSRAIRKFTEELGHLREKKTSKQGFKVTPRNPTRILPHRRASDH